MRFGGANQKELWLEFARHGFGKNAASSNTTANTDIDPTPDFEPIGTLRPPCTSSAEAHSARRSPARIYVGHYEGRVSPIADTDPATSGANLDDVALRARDVRVRRHGSRLRPGPVPRADPQRARTGRHARGSPRTVLANARRDGDGERSGRRRPPRRATLRNLIDDSEGTGRRSGRSTAPGTCPWTAVRSRSTWSGTTAQRDPPRPGERPDRPRARAVRRAAPVRDLGV